MWRSFEPSCRMPGANRACAGRVRRRWPRQVLRSSLSKHSRTATLAGDSSSEANHPAALSNGHWLWPMRLAYEDGHGRPRVYGSW